MRPALPALLLLAASVAAATELEPGFASVAVVSTEADGRYRMDGRVFTASALKTWLVELDDQLPIRSIRLEHGGVAASETQAREIAEIAKAIGARLEAEHAEHRERAAPADTEAEAG